MPSIDLSNNAFKTAVSFVNSTNKPLFITGKAGTGKTTFLKYIKLNSRKRMAVVAPTGVAAINAGGVTLHSFFQLPFGAFVPAGSHGWNLLESGINNRDSLLKNLRLTSIKRDVIKELELLVIDEVSMVRADLLDAIDAVMRHVRRQPHVPFGGVQMVYIGDLYQLPPVVNNAEWEILRDYYATPFFFNAKAVEQSPPVYIELKKIYRQSDRDFINLLNNIRNNCCTRTDLDLLHSFYRPEFSPGKDEKYITLTSHNFKADQINQQELERTPGATRKFEAMVEGDFPDRAFPVEKDLCLKEGAQVMFIKNDKGEERRYYNGKLAIVNRLEKDKIFVQFNPEDKEMEVEREIWKNIKYQYNKEDDQIEEEELGTFSHYPLRLAWAITIHKSQGLTFEKAIIDAGASFAAGQVYVALSRLTSLEGLVLLSKINPSSISTDNRITTLADTELAEDQVTNLLAVEQKAYVQQVLMQSFGWDKLVSEIDKHLELYAERQIPEKERCIEWCKSLTAEALVLQEVADKFAKWLHFIFSECEADNYAKLCARTQAAAVHFSKELDEKMLHSLQGHVKEVSVKHKVKKYLKDLHHLQFVIEKKKNQVNHAAELANALANKTNFDDLLQVIDSSKENAEVKPTPAPSVKPKAQKGDSSRMSLQLFKEGKTIVEIAESRSMTYSTIHGHLTSYIATGEIDVLDILDGQKLDKILTIATEQSTSTAIKEALGPDFSYPEIRAALVFMAYEKSLKNSAT